MGETTNSNDIDIIPNNFKINNNNDVNNEIRKNIT